MRIFESLCFVVALVVGCTKEEISFDMLNTDAGDGISVLTAVQLGAEPGCSGLGGRVSGNIAVIGLVEDAEIVLVLKDGEPLCVDTVDIIKEELENIGSVAEPDYMDTPSLTEDETPSYGDLMREAGERRGFEQNGGSSDSGSGPLRFDPDPQPALELTVSLSKGNTAVSEVIATTPASGSGTSGSNQSGGTSAAPTGN